MKNKLVIIAEKSDGVTPDDGTISARMHYGDDLLTTVGDDIAEIEQNFRDQFRDFYQLDASNLKFEIKYDLEAFFEAFDALNISAIGRLAGINESQMRQYKKGIKYPSETQVKKIEDAVHDLGKKMQKVSLMAVA